MGDGVSDALEVHWDVQPCASGVQLFPRCVFLEKSGIGEALGECFVRSMVCSLGITQDGRKDSHQGVVYEKVVLKNLRNAGTSRCVSLEAAYASMLSTLGMQEMDAWILAWSMIHAASWRRRTMVVELLTLLCLAQLSVAALLMPVLM